MARPPQASRVSARGAKILVPALALALVTALAGPSSAGLAPQAGFAAESTVLWRGRTRLVPFELTEPVAEETALEARVADPSVARLVAPPRVLAGETRGWLRLEALEEGRTELELGAARLALEVRAPRVEARVRLPRARVVAPSPGAAVWGRVAVGVEASPGWDGAPIAADELALLLPGGERLAPAAALPPELGRTRRFVFELDADALPEGPLALRARLARADGAVALSEPLTLRVVRPGPDALTSGELEAGLAQERPERYGTAHPRPGADPEASGGGYLALYGNNPTALASVELEHAGRYQMVLVARGDFAAGAFPSVGLCVDHPYSPSAAARVPDTRWRRAPLGAPVELEAGAHVLALRYLNDRSVPGTADRNLYLDRYELLRLPDEPDGAPAAASSVAMAMTTNVMSAGAATSMAMTDSNAAEMSMSMSMEDGGGAGASGSLRIAFDRPLDGLPVNGRVVLEGACRWEGARGLAAPIVQLELDGEVVAEEQAAAPLFALDPAALSPGEHVVRMVARLADGSLASTPPQRLRMPHELPGATARAAHVFPLVDERWRAAGLLTERNRLPGHAYAELALGDRLELALPEELAGEFDVLLRAMGPGWPNAARARVSLVTEAGEEELGSSDAWGWWSFREGPTVTLAPGPKALALEFERYAPRGDVGDKQPDRGLWVSELILRERRAGEDVVPPRARVTYPPEGHVAFGLDAVVIEACDDERVARAELWVDGLPTGQETTPRDASGLGHLVLPLVLRDLAPGPHTLSVRVYDTARNQGRSREVGFEVLAEEPAEPGAYARAVRLLDRFAFGPEDEELAAVLTTGERAWLEARLAPPGPREEAALDAALLSMRDASAYQVKTFVLRHALRSANPVRARFALWLENHFSTWLQKAGAGPEWREHQEFLRLGPAAFEDLLLGSATSAAMLYYLDQQESYAGALNENYAREILELHSLGVDGGYTQEDVTELAGVLAGLTVADEAHPSIAGVLSREVRYDPALGDSAAHTVLGLRFDARDRFDRLRLALELCAAHPSTARHVARSLAEHYVADPPPAGLVDELARVFLESGGDLRELLLAMAAHPAFHAAELAPRVATPLDYGLRLARAAGTWQIEGALSRYLDQSGMGVFDRQTPDGWPEEDAAWVDTNATLARWRFAEDHAWVVTRLVPATLRRPPAGDRGRWMQALIDATSWRLTGALLGEDSNAAALALLEHAEPRDSQVYPRLGALIAGLPEAALRR